MAFCAMTEWGNRAAFSVPVEEADLEPEGECESGENDQRGCGGKGHEHAGSVAVVLRRRQDGA
jgi:hypothetical protein